jgi:ribosome-associated translation inhibitor RaiA
MEIQISVGKNLQEKKMLSGLLTPFISDMLSRYKNKITQLEVQLSDEKNGHENGWSDKQVKLEAYLKDKNPITVSDQNSNYVQAVKGAVDKLRATLYTTLER